ncbi:hypothetical protein CDAR_537541 [Caerostris darwini]|uniref:Reverse transcriptase domain-containing protein n=1 Tax=Caerostris darwini TaxID=1538125 RepID=A0AAV4QAZ0_9ARAC|nr:hypothetical protein CDAR_537541 [Caerostris darwini]
MERMVYNRLNWYLESHSLLAEEQAGFRKFKSTAHHVTRFSQAIKDALDSKQVLTAIAVDLKSAFGKKISFLMGDPQRYGTTLKINLWHHDNHYDAIKSIKDFFGSN